MYAFQDSKFKKFRVGHYILVAYEFLVNSYVNDVKKNMLIMNENCIKKHHQVDKMSAAVLCSNNLT